MEVTIVIDHSKFKASDKFKAFTDPQVAQTYANQCGWNKLAWGMSINFTPGILNSIVSDKPEIEIITVNITEQI